MKGKNYQEIYARCNEIMGDGVLPGCREIASRGVCANECCWGGAVLLDGEFLKNVPDGVTIFRRKVGNCFGRSGCKFSSTSKPLICKMAPVVGIGIAPDLSRKVLLVGEKDSDGVVMMSDCPAGISDSFYKKVRRVIGVLKDHGIWTNSESRLVLPPADADEYARFIASGRWE